MEDPNFVEQGGHGAVFYPRLPCQRDSETTIFEEKVLDDGSSISFDSHVSKIMRKETDATKNEINIIKHVNQIDPDGQFHLVTKYKCAPSNDENTIKRVTEIDRMKRFYTVQKQVDLFHVNNILLLIPYGGQSLDKWCIQTSLNTWNIKQFFVEAYRILRGLYELQQGKNSKTNQGFMVHGDVLPVNIVYDEERNRLNLIDFGNSMYSGEITKGFQNKLNDNSISFNKTKVEGIAPEWHLLNNQDFWNSQSDSNNASKEISGIMKSESGKKLCQVIYLATSTDSPSSVPAESKEKTNSTTPPKPNADVDSGPESLKQYKNEHTENYWRNLAQLIDKIKNENSRYNKDKLLEKAIATNDMYAIGYTLLSVLGCLRQFSQEAMTKKKDNMQNIIDKVILLCLRVVNGDVFERPSWLEFLSQYEEILVENKTTRDVPEDQEKALPLHNYGDNNRDWIMHDLIRRLGAETAKAWDLQKQIENQFNAPKELEKAPVIFDKFKNEKLPHEYEIYDEIIPNDSYGDLNINRCSAYADKIVHAFYIESDVSYNIVTVEKNGFYGKNFDTYQLKPMLLVNMDRAIVSVFWPKPQKVAWVWTFYEDNNDKETIIQLINELETLNETDHESERSTNDESEMNRGMESTNQLETKEPSQEDISQDSDHDNDGAVQEHKVMEYSEEEVEFVLFTPSKPLQQPVGNIYEMTCVMTRLTIMVLGKIIQDDDSLNDNAKTVSFMIRDHWAQRLSTGLNALFLHNNPIDLDVFLGIFHTIMKQDDDQDRLNELRTTFQNLMTIKSDKIIETDNENYETDLNCQNYLPDPSWLMRGLAEYTNAYFSTVDERNVNWDIPCCVFMPSEVDGNWERRYSRPDNNDPTQNPWFMPFHSPTFSNKVDFIINKLQNNKNVFVVFPEVSPDANRTEDVYYIRWFFYEFHLDSKNESTTLRITTPRNHVFEVTREFARDIIGYVKSGLDPNTNVVREDRPFPNASESTLPLFVESLSSSWFTEEQPPSSKSILWLKQCQDFLIDCGFSYNENYDNICNCKSGECSLVNKAPNLN